jgi:hypothetical protein
MILAVCGGGGGGPVDTVGSCGKAAGVGGGVGSGAGFQFSLSSQKASPGEKGSGVTRRRGDGAGVQLAESVLTVKGIRILLFGRWVAAAKGAYSASASTKMVKFRLRSFFWLSVVCEQVFDTEVVGWSGLESLDATFDFGLLYDFGNAVRVLLAVPSTLGRSVVQPSERKRSLSRSNILMITTATARMQKKMRDV